ncbi:4378_t:CDS:2 [Ambispora gerdemannii]|uniref:4378_t:CDS:1 n=1 Tax=Ambispora gerdemannii TaxID=144530 RepID=A0A9N9DVB1_9GLOM|nr:4378_t:CDS:2 [Ambispora gerdemannii]
MPEFTKNLIRDLAGILEHSYEYNIVICVGETANYKEFQAHSLILRARSPYFRVALSQDWAKKDGNSFVFKKPNITPKVFELILKYMYTGVVDLDDQLGSDVFELLVAADELEINELINYAQIHLIESKSSWLEENIVTILHAANLHESFKPLKDYSGRILAEDPHFIFRSDDFFLLEESELISLLQRQDLGMEEIEVWNSIIEWGISNTAHLKEQDNWVSADFVALANTLHQCLPLIRYYDISQEDYYNKVALYEKILPKNMAAEISVFHNDKQLPEHVLPSRSAIHSTIINSDQAGLISLWIDKQETSGDVKRKNPYDFNLIFRGSRDGFEASKFRELCAHVTNTVVVAKINGTNRVIGGYNPSNWGGHIADNSSNLTSYLYPNNEQHIFNSDTIIFSFEKPRDITSAKFSRRVDSDQTIGFHTTYGPYFYGDLLIGNKCNANATCWYRHCNFEHSIIEGNNRKKQNFKVENYEVFHVVPKRKRLSN